MRGYGVRLACELRGASLREVLPATAFADPLFVRNYEAWEGEVATPALRKKGWAVLNWSADKYHELDARCAIAEIRHRRWRLFYEIARR